MDEGGEGNPPEGDNPFRRTASQSQEQDLPLPRTIISRDAPSVKSLLGVLSLGGAAAAAAWRFLMRLPTNPEMLEGIRRLEGFQSGGGGSGGEKWKDLLGPPGSHDMLYTLQIVDGVLDFLAGAGGVGDGPAGDNKEAFALDGPESVREWEVRMCAFSSCGGSVH